VDLTPRRPWLSVDQVAAALGAHPEVVRRWLRAGQLQGFKVGRSWHVPPDALPPAQSSDMPLNVITGRVQRVDRAAGIAWLSTDGEALAVVAPPARSRQMLRVLLGADAILVSRQRLRRVSARNQWGGRVAALVHRGAGVEVHVETTPPLIAWMTPGAVEELGLRPGVRVVLVFKAGSCRVSREENPARRSRR
jgi:molybdopterin-binding protein